MEAVRTYVTTQDHAHLTKGVTGRYVEEAEKMTTPPARGPAPKKGRRAASKAPARKKKT